MPSPPWVALCAAVSMVLLVGGTACAQEDQPVEPPLTEEPVASEPAPPPVDPPPDVAALRLNLQPLVAGLRAPLAATHAGDGSGRLFVAEKRGSIRVVKDGQLQATPFLDISPIVRSTESERGLLGLAFHPRYEENGLFFVNYSDRNGDTVVARYQVSPDPNVADPGTGKVILFQPQPYANHNGGHLLFGPDGYLWIGLGDGGSGGDPQGNGQSMTTWLGKMLRIDVDGGDPYGIPGDNPFVGVPDHLPEIWALGLRNPWRYSFDRVTLDLYVADVGQNAWEEVNVVPWAAGGGQNYGWNRMEGAHCFRAQSCDQTGLQMPFTEYGHDLGCSVTGGFVYRGAQYPRMQGAYLYGDYCSGRIWAAAYQPADGSWAVNQVASPRVQISSFGEDEAGELYVTGMGDGTLYRVTVAP